VKPGANAAGGQTGPGPGSHDDGAGSGSEQSP